LAFRILVVEDDSNKLTQLGSFLSDVFPAVEVTAARSLQSGIKAIKAGPPSLVLLDMTLPNFDATPGDPGGQTHNFGGTEFLNQLERFEITVPVIVVTQFITFGRGTDNITLADLDAKLKMEFGNNYVGSVYYHASIHRWKDELSELIRTQISTC
jgi:CheY-like chemotaxis protein